MTKLDWDKARRQASLAKPTIVYPRYSKLDRQRFGFRAKFSGTCENCKVPFAPGTQIRYNADDKLIHGRGCPIKSKRS